MSSVYYYLVSGLPFLHFKVKPPFSYSYFINDLSSWLSPKDFFELSMAKIDIENIPEYKISSRILKKWIIFEHSLRNELVRIRANNLNISPETNLRTNIDYDPTLFPRVREALKENSPYNAEINLMELRWNFLSNLESENNFDLTALIIYGLKIQILERLELFEIEKGQNVFDSIYKDN